MAFSPIVIPQARILSEYRTAVIEHIKGAIPEFKDVGSHGGTFTEQSLARFSMRTPSCRVAVLGMQSIERQNTGELRGPVRTAAYIIAEDEPPLESWDVAMMFVERLMTVVEGNHLGYRNAGIAQVSEWQNLFSLDGEQRGATLMGVSWTQDLLFGTNFQAEFEQQSPDIFGFHRVDISNIKQINEVGNERTVVYPTDNP